MTEILKVLLMTKLEEITWVLAFPKYTWALTWEWALSLHPAKIATWVLTRDTMVVHLCAYMCQHQFVHAIHKRGK